MSLGSLFGVLETEKVHKTSVKPCPERRLRVQVTPLFLCHVLHSWNILIVFLQDLLDDGFVVAVFRWFKTGKWVFGMACLIFNGNFFCPLFKQINREGGCERWVFMTEMVGFKAGSTKRKEGAYTNVESLDDSKYSRASDFIKSVISVPRTRVLPRGSG